jgi:hypothetical protein
LNSRKNKFIGPEGEVFSGEIPFGKKRLYGKCLAPIKEPFILLALNF